MTASPTSRDVREFSMEWAAAVFGLGTVRDAADAGRGQGSALGVLRVATSRGVFAVKRLDREPSAAALAIEQAACAAGYSIAPPLQTTDGRPYAACRLAGDPVWVRVSPWVPGNALDWGVVDPALSFRVGGLLAQMHALAVPEAALQGEPWVPPGPAGWLRLAANADARGMGWANALREKIPLLITWEEHVSACAVDDEALVPSQRDLHPPNVIEGGDGRLVVVDWDAAGPVNAREETALFALVWASAPGQSSPDREAVAAFIGGYRAAGGTFVSRGVVDLTHQARSRLWWLTRNVERDLSARPGPDPDLTPALIDGVPPLDLDALAATATLFAG